MANPGFMGGCVSQDSSLKIDTGRKFQVRFCLKVVLKFIVLIVLDNAMSFHEMLTGPDASHPQSISCFFVQICFFKLSFGLYDSKTTGTTGLLVNFNIMIVA